MSKTIDLWCELLEEMTMNNYQWPTKKLGSKKVAGIYEINPIAALFIQVTLLAKQLQQSQISMHAVQATCKFGNGPHFSEECLVANSFS